MANNTRGGCVRKAWNPSSSRPILIYFEFRSKPSLITVICMDPHSPNKLFATKYCFLILLNDTSFFVFIYFFFFLLFALLLIFTKIILLLLLFFFLKFFFLFFHVPGCSGIFRNVLACSRMFRNVPCSGFYRRPRLFIYTFKSGTVYSQTIQPFSCCIIE